MTLNSEDRRSRRAFLDLKRAFERSRYRWVEELPLSSDANLMTNCRNSSASSTDGKRSDRERRSSAVVAHNAS